MDLVVPIIVVAIIMLMVSAVLIKRGKRWLLGGRILRTFEATVTHRRGAVKSRMKVHLIETRLPKTKHIGLEIRQSTGLGTQLVPVSLSVDEAKELADMLKQASELYVQEDEE